MIVDTRMGSKTAAVLIPTRGRPERFAKVMEKQPWLNSSDTYIGIEFKERDMYGDFLSWYKNPVRVWYDNPDESVGFVRERLRRAAVKDGYDYYIATDDNARYPEHSMPNLVRCAAEFPYQPSVAVGYHGFMEFTNRGKTLPDDREVNGIHSFEHIGTILMCIPHALYEPYTYPDDAHALEDRHFVLWCLARGVTHWRVCKDAPFSKSRYEAGGSGSLEKRQLKCGKGMARLCLDFPLMMGIGGVYRAPWQQLIKMARGENFERRPDLGSIRPDRIKMVQTRRKIKVRRKRV